MHEIITGKRLVKMHCGGRRELLADSDTLFVLFFLVAVILSNDVKQNESHFITRWRYLDEILSKLLKLTSNWILKHFLKFVFIGLSTSMFFWIRSVVRVLATTIIMIIFDIWNSTSITYKITQWRHSIPKTRITQNDNIQKGCKVTASRDKCKMQTRFINSLLANYWLISLE